MADMAPVHPSLDLLAGWVQKCLCRNCVKINSFTQIQMLIKELTTSYGREEIYVCKEIIFFASVKECMYRFMYLYTYVHRHKRIYVCIYKHIGIDVHMLTQHTLQGLTRGKILMQLIYFSYFTSFRVYSVAELLGNTV